MGTQGRVRRANRWLPYPGIGLAVLMVFASTLAEPQSAQGDIVTLQVTGSVTSMGMDNPSLFDLDGSVTIGSPYQLTFVIDTDAPDTESFSDKGVYELVATSGQLGNYTWSKTTPPVLEIETRDNYGYDGLSLGQYNSDISGTFLVEGTPTLLTNTAFEFTLAGISLIDSSMTVLDSDALVIPVLDDWEEGVFGWNITLDENIVGVQQMLSVHGTVDQILVIPEPGAVLVLGLGALFYMFKR